MDAFSDRILVREVFSFAKASSTTTTAGGALVVLLGHDRPRRRGIPIAGRYPGVTR
jgi:hypothetical protein